MALSWYKATAIRGEEVSPTDWLRAHYMEYTATEAAAILSKLGLGAIGEAGVRNHLRTKHGLSYGQGRKPTMAGGGDALPDDRTMACGVRVQAVVAFLKRKGAVSLRDLSEYLDRSEATVMQMLDEMKRMGFKVQRDHRQAVLPDVPVTDYQVQPLFDPGETVDICMGIVSDTHGGSRFEQVTALKDFVHVAHEEYGVKHMLHCGDAFAGMGVYRGQAAEVYARKADEQAETVANNRPAYDDLRWYLLGGNHCYSYYRLAGLDVRELLAEKDREDITLLGYDAADLPLLPGVDARLWHPSGGPAYALSYRGQKYASELAFDELMAVTMGDKPRPTVRMLLIGHFHCCFMFDQAPLWY